MRERLAGRADVHLSCEVEAAEAAGGRARLTLVAGSGARTTLHTDHVIAATGYRTDVARLGFIAPELRSRIRCAGGAPELSADYESSAPGLFFVGPAAAGSFGPVNRFVFGVSHPSRRLARRLAGARSRSTQAAPIEAAVTA
jgi:lysine/ornithine N-monooxygenase